MLKSNLYCNYQENIVGINSELDKISNNVYIQDCENCSIFGGNEKLIIGFGVKDLVVVDAGDVILVMDKGRDQEIKHLLNSISGKKEFKEYL